MMPPMADGMGGLTMGGMEWGHEFEHMGPPPPIAAGPMATPYHPFLMQQQHQNEEDMFLAMEMEEVFAAQQQQQHHGPQMHSRAAQQSLVGPTSQHNPMLMMMGHRPMMMMAGPPSMMRMGGPHQQCFQCINHSAAVGLAQRSTERPHQQQSAPRQPVEDEAPVQTFTVEGKRFNRSKEKTRRKCILQIIEGLARAQVEIDEVEGKIVSGDPTSVQATTADAGGPDWKQ